MKTQLLLLFYFCFSVLNSSAQFIPEKVFTDPTGLYGFRNVTSISTEHIGALGYTQGFGYYNRNFTLAKFDKNFGFKWAKGYGNNTVCRFEMNAMLELSDKGFVAVGIRQDSITNVISSVMVRTDSLGDIIFAHDLIDTIRFNEIQPGGLLGNTDSTFILLSKIWIDGSVAVSKVDYNGNVLRNRIYRSYINSHTAEYATSLRRANGNYVVILRNVPSQGDMLVFLEFDSDLNLLTNKNFVLNTSAFCYDIAENPVDQSLILVGWLSSSPYLQPLLIKLDAMGNLIWSEAILPSLTFTDIKSVLVKDNKYYFSGTNGYGVDFIPFVMVTDTSGNILNSETYTHVGQYTVFNSMIDMQDSMMILMSGSLNSRNGPGYVVIDTSLHSACSNDDITFTATPFALSENLDLYVDSIPIGFIDLTSQYQTLSFVLMENDYCLSNSIETTELNKDRMLLSTNGKMLSIELSVYSNCKTMLIYSSTGQLVREINAEQRKTTIDLSLLPNGMYIVKAEGDAVLITGKVVLVN